MIDLHSKFQDISNLSLKKVIEIDDARLIKTNLLNLYLFNKTIFLDCDTLVLQT
jgi:alpha-N-acetylglucosamine transferase